jgi:hypothetical protein
MDEMPLIVLLVIDWNCAANSLKCEGLAAPSSYSKNE